ncbi:MAG: beta-N-acetylhexosaminidase [Burkholderiales bacterium]
MSAKALPLGPIMLDLGGVTLGADDRRRLQHPLTGGVILFSRNFVDPAQLDRLTAEIRALRNPPLLIAVDHEGGRVQRFREGFTVLPAMAELGRSWDQDARHALRLAQDLGFVLAAELRAHGVDLALAPVLDVDHGMSEVIGDRAFHSDPRAIAELARALLQGFKQAGMSGVGKHFPGHGHVLADSHHASPVDERTYEEIEAVDLAPFRRLIEAGLGGIMPAHVIFPKIDGRPAGYSTVWLKTVLRERLGFGGVIFSDDLSMEGAGVGGSVVERATAALVAGCDMVVICNDPLGVDELLEGLKYPTPAVSLARLARMHGWQRPQAMDALRKDSRYTRALDSVAAISRRDGELPLA